MHNTGQTGGTVDADLDALEAWNIHTGSPSIVVAIIDTGIDYNHDDLSANIWTNEDEIPDNGIDDDANGYTDDYRGWNFTVPESEPLAKDPMDDSGDVYHGTHVAGTIGAKGNNNIGGVGVCWEVKLMALKAGNSAGEFTTAAIIDAIDYATRNGARLFNNSYAGPENSQSVLMAIDRARASGKLFIAAADNHNSNNDLYPRYPASYDLDNIISVLATDHNDLKASYSNFGPYSVDVGAPGGTDPSQAIYNIYSTKKNNAYQFLAGTSMASPHVAGEAALIWAHRPSLNWWQVKNILMKSVDPKGSLWGKVGTEGRVNAYNALTRPTPNLPAAPSNLGAAGYGCDIKLTWNDNSNNEDGFEIYRKSGYVFTLIDWTGPNVREYWDRDLLPGTYYYYIRAYNQYGNSQKTLQQGAKAFQCQ
jgi:subtilisin family serine protease